MKLERLVIEIVPSYKDNAGAYEGHAAFSDPKGDLRLPLDSKMSMRILDLVAEEVVAVSKQIASDLTTNCIAALPTSKQLTLDKTA